MIEVLIYGLVLIFLFYLFIKGMTNIIKGIFIISVVILIYSLVVNKFNIGVPIFSISTISNFLRFPNLDYKTKLINLKILGYFYDANKLYIVVKNSGYFPITDFTVFLDDVQVNTIKKPTILLPQRIENIEVENKNFTKITIVVNDKRYEYHK